jgi:hypothetical protein
MSATMAVGAQRNDVIHGVWAALTKRLHVMNLKIGVAVL